MFGPVIHEISLVLIFSRLFVCKNSRLLQPIFKKFKITTIRLLFPLISSLANTGYSKHEQVLTNSKRCLLWNFFRHWDNFCAKFVIPPLYIIFFRYQKLSAKAKRPPCEFILWHEKFSTSFLWCPLSVYSNFRADRWAAPTLSCSQLVTRLPQNFW